MKKYFLLLIASVILLNSSAQDSLHRQSVYKFKLGFDIPIGAISLGTGVTSLILHKRKQGLTLDQINALSPNDVNKFDRGAIYQHSKAASIASDVFQYTFAASPALLFIDKDVRKDWKTVTPIWIETFALTTALTLFTKELTKRNRPYVYSDYGNGNKFSKDARSSFWSGHTAIVSASCFFIAQVYSDYHPTSRWKPLIWTGAAIIPALTGITRYKAGKHYWTDVITSYAVGALVGTMVPFIHKRFK